MEPSSDANGPARLYSVAVVVVFVCRGETFVMRPDDFEPTSLSFLLTDWCIIKAQAGATVTMCCFLAVLQCLLEMPGSFMVHGRVLQGFRKERQNSAS